jgi:hypothetical protein
VRDVGLSFSAKADEKILGVLKPKKHKQEQALLHTVGAVLAAARNGGWVSYSRRPHWYAGKQRYHGPHYSYRLIIAAVDTLAEANLIENQIVAPGTNNMIQSRMRAAPRLLRLMADTEIVPVRPAELLQLRAHDHNLINYAETRQTHALRRRLATLNEYLGSIELSIEHPAIVRIGNYSIFAGPELCGIDDGLTCIWAPTPYVKRAFCRRSWCMGGRYYGFWQQFPSHVRSALRINGESVSRLDYSAMHTMIFCNDAGIKLDRHPYDVDGYSRGEVKDGLNIAYNAKTLPAARGALAAKSAERDGRKMTASDHQRAAQVIDAIGEAHPGIVAAFGSDSGAAIQYRDSEIMRRVMEACAQEGIPSLPVHDELVIPCRHESRVEEIMVDAFATLAPGPNRPTLNVSYSESPLRKVKTEDTEPKGRETGSKETPRRREGYLSSVGPSSPLCGNTFRKDDKYQ